MLRATFAIVLALGSFGAAGGVRILEQPETSYELSLDQVTLPAGATAAVTFKTCAQCRTIAHSVNLSTRYFVNGAEVPLDELRRVAAVVRQQERGAATTFVGVFVDIESQGVTRIVVRQGAR